jgi:aquaporin Z
MALRSSAEDTQPQAGHTVTIEADLPRKAAAEFLGTALLVFFGAGVSTVSFGFRAFGSSVAAGVLVTGLTFGIVLTALVALIGPISSCHVNPAVTLGAFLTRQISIVDAVGYWVAQFAGGIAGALLLLWVMSTSPFYIKSRIGLGTQGWGSASLLHASAGGAFLIEVVITAVFVLVVLAATRREANAAISGAVIGLALALVNIMAIPVDGASANPARSFGPALVTAGQPLRQVWLFILAPLVGAVLAAGVYMLFHPMRAGSGFGRLRAQSAMSHSAADEGPRPAGVSTTATASRPADGAPAAQSAPVSRGGTAGDGAAPGAGASARPDPPRPPDRPDGPGGAGRQRLFSPAKAGGVTPVPRPAFAYARAHDHGQDGTAGYGDKLAFG